jgi:predicted RNase H-like nuclease (RuvC/YqgF family)
MYHSQVNEFKYEIERLNRDLQEMKKKYYRLRKKQQDKIPYEIRKLENSFTQKTTAENS